MEKLYIIKIGGNIIDEEEKLVAFLKDFASITEKKLLVHGGGKLATRVAEAMGVKQHMVDGRRITDAETLKIVTMVYVGYINKNIVAKLQANNCNAIGLTGADANVITAHKRNHPQIDYGFAGDIDLVNSTFITSLLTQNISVVLAPITHDKNGTILNTNADTIAQETAKAMSKNFEVTLIYCFEKNGVLLNAQDDTSVIKKIDKKYFTKLKEDKIIFEGMIPKLDNAFAALQAGVQHIFIGHAQQLLSLVSHQSGTAIINE